LGISSFVIQLAVGISSFVIQLSAGISTSDILRRSFEESPA